MKFGFFSLLVFIAILFSSCFEWKNQVRFRTDISLASQHSYFKRDSVTCIVSVEPETRNIVVPFFIFLSDKKKSRITYTLYGKGISAREYECKFSHLEIKNGDIVVGRSRDSLLFADGNARDMAVGISPFYTTSYIMKLIRPKEVNLYLEMEFDAVAKDGTKIPVKILQPMEKIRTKDLSIFRLHIIKK
ncbi:MAG: hypothetical protein ACXVC6_02420 [Bacteroidia bacterium]